MSNLQELTQKIEQEAGFEVYAWACGRPDLNDFGNDYVLHGIRNSYTRALYNFRNQERIKATSSEGPSDTIRGLRVSPKMKAENCKAPVVAYGTYKKTITKPVKREIGKRRLFGILPRKVITEEVKEKVRRPLSEVIKTQNLSDTYFVQFILPVTVKDKVGRPTRNHSLTVYTDKQLVKQIVSYLQSNPQDFEKMIRQILPREQYPNVNKGILDKMETPGEVTFLEIGE